MSEKHHIVSTNEHTPQPICEATVYPLILLLSNIRDSSPIAQGSASTMKFTHLYHLVYFKMVYPSPPPTLGRLSLSLIQTFCFVSKLKTYEARAERCESVGGGSQRQTFDPEKLFHYIKSASSMQNLFRQKPIDQVDVLWYDGYMREKGFLFGHAVICISGWLCEWVSECDMRWRDLHIFDTVDLLLLERRVGDFTLFVVKLLNSSLRKFKWWI